MSAKHPHRLRTLISQYRKPLLWVGFYSAVANFLAISPTLYMLQVYDRVMISQNEITLIVLSLMVTLFFLVMAFSEWLRSRLLVRLSVRLDDDLNLKVFERGFAAFIRHRQQNPTEALNDLVTLRQFITGNGVLAFFDIPWIPIYIGAAFLLHYELGLAALLFGVVQVVIAIWIERNSAGQFSRLSDAGMQSRKFLQTKLRSAALIDAMGMRGHLRERWLGKYLEHMSLQDHASEWTHKQMLVSKFVQYSQQSLILGLGALLVIDNQISPGAMVAANMLLAKALQPLQSLVMSWRGYLQARESYRRLDDLFERFDEDDQDQLITPASAEVTLNQLRVQPEGRSQPILDVPQLTLAAGQLVMVLGPSGAGKSTLARLLTGADLGQSGEVLIGGVPARHVDRHFLGYMPQEVELLDGTVAENIARFEPDEPEKIVRAAQTAQAHELILRLPQGYDTPVGLAGQLLSGGQRQRVALARALYGQPRLVILDEPNANLDDVGEKALVAALQQLKSEQVTVLVISHRPNLIPICDRLLVMERGQVARDLSAEQIRMAAQNAQTAAPRPA